MLDIHVLIWPYIGCILFTTLFMNSYFRCFNFNAWSCKRRWKSWWDNLSEWSCVWHFVAHATVFKTMQSWNDNVLFQEKQTSNLAGGLVWNMMSLLVKMTAGKQIFHDHCILPGCFFYFPICFINHGENNSVGRGLDCRMRGHRFFSPGAGPTIRILK